MPIELTIDVVEFINQSLLKVRGKLNIFSQKDLDNTQGKIHGSRVIAKSRAGKVSVGAPIPQSRKIGWASSYNWNTPNGSYIEADDCLEVDGFAGIDVLFGLLNSQDTAIFRSAGMMNITSSKMRVQSNVFFDCKNIVIQTSPTTNAGYSGGWGRGHLEESFGGIQTGDPCSLIFGGDVNIAGNPKNFTMKAGMLAARNIYNNRGQKCTPNQKMGLNIEGGELSFSGEMNIPFENMTMGAAKIVAAVINLTGQSGHIDGGSHIRSMGQSFKHDVVGLIEGILQALGGVATIKGPQDNPHALISRQSLEGPLSQAPKLPIVTPADNVEATKALILAKRQEAEDQTSTITMTIPRDLIGFRYFGDSLSTMQGIAMTLQRTYHQHYVHPFMTAEQSMKKFIDDILGLAQGRDVLALEELKTYGKPALAGILQNHTYADPITGQEVSETFIVPTLFNISSNPALMAPGASIASTHGDISLAVANDLYARGVNVRARHAEEAADIAFLAGGRQTHQGVKMDGSTQTYVGLLGGVHVREDQHVQHYEYREGKRTVQGTITTSIANEYKGKHVIFMTPQGSLIFQNIIVDAEKFMATAPEGMVEFLAGVNAHQRVILEKGGDFFITKLKQTAENMVNYIGCDLDKVGTIEVNAKGAFIQRAQNSAMEWVDRIRMMQPGTDVSSVVLQNVYDIQTKEQRGLGAVFGALLGLSINALVPGIGSSFWAGLTKLGAVCSRAAMVCMLSMTSQALAKNNGNLGNTLHDLTGDQAFKTMLVAVGTAGITHGVCQGLPIPGDASGLIRHGVPAVIRETTNMSLQALTSRQGGDVGRSVMNVAGDIVQGMAAEGISRAVDSGAIGKTAAVGVHMLNGTGAHLIRGGNLQEAGIVGVATGLAEGAMYACVDPEAVAEKVYQEHPKATDEERQRHFDNEIRAHREMAHITAATVAGVVSESLHPGSGGEVVYAASHSAQLAIDHNFSNLVIGAGLTLHTLKPYHDAYESAGWGDAGMKAVKALLAANGGGAALGLEIAVNFAGGAVVMKACGKLVQFVKGRAMQFVKGDKIAKVEKDASFLRQTKVEDKRTVERLRENRNQESRPASSANAKDALNRKLRIIEKAQEKAVRTERLSDGRVRYYGNEVQASKPGITRGASHVTEHNPHTGQIREWRECYDHSGKVVRVHPKSIDGQVVQSSHYPLTQREIGVSK